MSNVLMIDKLHKNYHNKEGVVVALEDITLNIKEGEYIAIVGPSGCGKSTLLNIIGGIDTKSGGEIKMNDDIKVGYMLQDDCLFPWLNIMDNCLLGLKINGNLNDENIKYVSELLDTYGLSEFKYKYPSSLSGGMRQRVALIRTLALKPDILLLDEPFSALDYQTRLAVSDDVYNIIKDTGRTVIMITHDIAEAISMSDRIVVLTNRPAKVKKIYNIEMKDKGTPINNRKCSEFSMYYDMIWKEIDHHV
ncbi:MAG: ABC transporter ATP-binding protein [Bacilli bacterium]|nr:ABC transporter ATP-binding protein [Bacilli bacterium]